jgi:beta-galactosidase
MRFLLLPGLAGAVSLLAVETARPSPVASRIVIDARTPPPAPTALPFAIDGRSPSGHVLGANSRCLTFDGNPCFPVLGEFDFSRYPAGEWEGELLKMQAGGISTVATRVFWNHHEETEGQFDWSGARDLRRFAELCGKHGLHLWLKLGPVSHGGARNGGLPDWVVPLALTAARKADYAARAQRFLAAVGEQLRGLRWQDGGPLIGLQLQTDVTPNALGLAELKRLAAAAGLNPPFITASAAAATLPDGVLPVSGSFADGYWYSQLTELPPRPDYFFGPINPGTSSAGDAQRYPYLAAEMGGGMASAYHRRPVITTDDTAAMALVQLGNGASLYGYSVFHGGTNPPGRAGPLQATQDSPLPDACDLTRTSYDFQAPLGEFGQTTAAYRALRPLHAFLQNFGARLAPMMAYFPEAQPRDRKDMDTPRVSARSDGRRAFVFVNNYQRGESLPDHPGFQVSLRLPAGTVEVPRQPVKLPADTYLFWPVNFDVEGATLVSATAQPVCRLADPSTYVFFAAPGIAPEFVFADARGLRIESERARVTRTDGQVIVDRIPPGARVAFEVRPPGGSTVQVLVLTHQQARDLWKFSLGGQDRLVLCAGDLFLEEHSLHIRTHDADALQISLRPGIGRKKSGFKRTAHYGAFDLYAPEFTAFDAAVQVKKIRSAEPSQPLVIGPQGVALPPAEAAFAKCAGVWSLKFTGGNLIENRALLRITYVGDAARLYAGSRLVSDHFYNGRPWEIGLWRLTPAELAAGLELRILPLREGAQIYYPKSARPKFSDQGDAIQLKDTQLILEYEAELKLGR